MPDSNETMVPLRFPANGINTSNGYFKQPQGTTPTAVNVRAYDSGTARLRGGSRAGLNPFFGAGSTQQVNGTNKIQSLSCVVTTEATVTPCSCTIAVSNPFTVTSSADSGAGTLRAAIAAVNANTNDGIVFNISGSGPTITLASDLPAITSQCMIDGTAQAGGVTVDGGGNVMLDVNAAVYLDGVDFTDGTMKVEVGKSLHACDLDIGDSSFFDNFGSVEICNDLLGGTSTGFQVEDGASLTIGGGFVATGSDCFLQAVGTSSMTIGGNVTLGQDGYFYNGFSGPTDNVTTSIGGNLTISSGFINDFLYNQGTSHLSIQGNLSLGETGFIFNGTTTGESGTIIVGGNVTLGVMGSGDFVQITNAGTGTITIGGNLSLIGAAGNNLNSGEFSTDNATFHVIGNLTVDDNSNINGNGASILTVDGTYAPGSGVTVTLADTSQFIHH